MEVTIKWFAILLFCCKTSLCAADYNEVVIEDLCKDGNAVVILETDRMGVGMLKATSHPPYKPDKNCSIIIKPPADHGIVLSVQKIDMRKSGNSCQDYIKVYHSDRYTSPAIICHYPFDLKEKDSYFSKEPMAIVYHTSPALFPGLTNEEGFSLTYTVVADDYQYCMKEDIFRCNNDLCISKNLTCDGRNNCGDRSDEYHVVCDFNPQKGLQNLDWFYITVSSICTVVIVVVTVDIMMLFRRKRL